MTRTTDHDGPTSRPSRRSVVAGLAAVPLATLASPAWAARRSASSAYPPLLFQLDLSVWIYHLYVQSLVWPFDPYYEDLAGLDTRRREMMDRVRGWAVAQGRIQAERAHGVWEVRGPGSLSGFRSNSLHDPILTCYGLVDPASPALFKSQTRWIGYQPVSAIADRVGPVHVARRKAGAPAEDVELLELPASRPDRPDMLFCFEGGTGSKTADDGGATRSLMGLVLLRRQDDGGHDIHIAFRGSRSGSGARAVLGAFRDDDARGNPDWITDLGTDRITEADVDSLISPVGSVHRGFRTAMASILPNLIACLERIATLEPRPPRQITVTGHSLGGALAQHFVAAMLLGEQHGPAGRGPRTPAALHTWPWADIKLVTFGAPRAGDETFARALTQDTLQSAFFDSSRQGRDRQALAPTDRSIGARLSNVSRPAAFRVLVSHDPITTERVVGGRHVGTTVYVDKQEGGTRRNLRDPRTLADIDAHEPDRIREALVAQLESRRRGALLPAAPLIYTAREALKPVRETLELGSAAEYRALAEDIEANVGPAGLPAGAPSLDARLATFLALLHG